MTSVSASNSRSSGEFSVQLIGSLHQQCVHAVSHRAEGRCHCWSIATVLTGA
jgi:hypothetical protein